VALVGAALSGMFTGAVLCCLAASRSTGSHHQHRQRGSVLASASHLALSANQSPAAAGAGEDAAAAAGKVANGIVNGAYEATRFKTKPKHSTLETGGCAPPAAAATALDLRRGVQFTGTSTDLLFKSCHAVPAQTSTLAPAPLSPLLLQSSCCSAVMARRRRWRGGGRWRWVRCSPAIWWRRLPTCAHPRECK
jgi:hypothetical protein